MTDVNPDQATDDPRGYLNSLSAHQGRPGDTTLLHPDFAARLAGAVRDARAMGLDVGLESGYRTNDATGSKYDASGMSLHGYGAAADVSGIGDANSSTARLWASIAEAHGLHNPYWSDDAKPGTAAARTMANEYNHWQLIPDKLENRKDITDAIGQAGGDQSKVWNAIAPVTNVSAGKSLLDAGPLDSRSTPTTTPANLPHESIANLLTAYQNGAMDASDKAAFEKDVAAGKVMLPTGMTLGGAATKPTDGAFELPQNVIDLYNKSVTDPYNTSSMTVSERQQMDRDIAAGKAKLPSGAVLNQKYPSFLDNTKEAITGSGRSTPTTQKLPDYAGMPELNSLTKQSFMAALGTMQGDPSEIAKVIKSNYPDTQVTQDEKGNYILTSSLNGKQYAIKPGFTLSDIPRAGAQIAAFTPASRAGTVIGAGVANAATQTALEGAHAAAGGTFDPTAIATAGGLGAGIPLVAKAASAVASPAKALIGAVTGRAAPEAAGAEAAVQPAAAEMAGAPPLPPAGGAGPASVDATLAAAPHPAPAPEAAAAAPRNAAEAPLAPREAPAPAAPAAPAMTTDQLVGTMTKAASGDAAAAADVVKQAAPDPNRLAAANRLGVTEDLQPEHLTTNGVYKSIVGAVKSVLGSNAGVQLREGLANVAKKASDIIDTIGGTHDMSQLGDEIQTKVKEAYDGAKATAGKLYDQVRDAIPARAPVTADNTLNFIKQRAADLGGVENLSPMEKKILTKLSPKSEPVPVPEAPTGRITAAQFKTYQDAKNAATGLVQPKQPTYALLDDIRRNLGKVYEKRGEFADADDGLADQLYKHLTADQEIAANAHGVAETWGQAKKATQVYKGMQNDLTSLFGKQINNSVIPKIKTAMSALTQGSPQGLIKLMKAIPPELRQRVAASALIQALGRDGAVGGVNFGQYVRFFEGLRANKNSYNALMANLPAEARQHLHDLYEVAKGITEAASHMSATGNTRNIIDRFKDADTLMSRIYNVAKHAGKGLALEAVSSSIGLHGAGMIAGLGSALTAGKTTALQAADKFIGSQAFRDATRGIASGQSPNITAKMLAHSKEFTKFAKAVNSRELSSNKEKWILNALSAGNNNEAGQ